MNSFIATSVLLLVTITLVNCAPPQQRFPGDDSTWKPQDASGKEGDFTGKPPVGDKKVSNPDHVKEAIDQQNKPPQFGDHRPDASWKEGDSTERPHDFTGKHHDFTGKMPVGDKKGNNPDRVKEAIGQKNKDNGDDKGHGNIEKQRQGEWTGKDEQHAHHITTEPLPVAGGGGQIVP